ncbi:MAG: lysylphosphatidylglycerol synthase domain-containing protein [Candidatus Nanopelagicales bacterium]|jgi:undecaprenyl-diphosphatase|nr:lysylphosphatidylglycerol synthase domain-containing protein [Candidatus Nanopelagicales bacterium]
MTVADAPSRFAPSQVGVARDPRDVSRLLWYLLVVALGVLAGRGADQTTAGAEGDLVELVGRLPAVVLAFTVIGVQVLHLLLFLGIPLFLLVTRRFRRLAIYLLGVVASSALLSVASTALELDGGAASSGQDATERALEAWPPSQSVATAVCAVVLLSPHLARPWRRFGWAFVTVLALLRVVTADQVVLDLVLAVGIGGVVGTALLLVFGRRIEVPTASAVMAALDRIGLHAVAVERTGAEATASTPFHAQLADGRGVHCKVVSSTEHAADRLLRGYRRVRVRDLGEEVPFSTVRRAAAVEAMLAMSAAAAGARTPEVLGVAPLPVRDAMVIVFEEVPGERLDRVPAERITDGVLDQAWQAVAGLRAAGLAHRDLQLSSWLLGPDDRLWLIDYSFGEPAATDGALSADIAELLSATYAVVGAERAVAAAGRVLGGPSLAAGLSHLVPMALTRATRAAVKGQPDGLAPLVEATAAACGVQEPEFAPIERVRPRTLVMAGLLALAVYVLLPQLADLPRMLEAIREADRGFAAAALLASVVTYVGSGVALANAAPLSISTIQATLASVAATFVGAIAPPGVAQVGLNARFYAKQGMSSTVAISATAAKEVAVAVVHVLLLILMAIAAGSTGALQQELDKLPSLRTVGIVVAVLIALVVAAAATPRVRGLVRDTILPAVRESMASLRELASSPVKMLLLFVGALVLQVAYVAALYFATRALGGEVGFVTIGLIYLTVGSVASVAPTPGGIGAVEAVLLAALTGVGMAAAPALAAVFLYRLVTFWIPIPVGGLAFRSLAARDLL